MAEEIITPSQRQFLDFFKKETDLRQFFYLTGGTALSFFYFRHRLSEDLDFFAEKDFSLEIVQPFVNRFVEISKPKKQEYNKLFNRHIFIFTFAQKKILKVEFGYFEHPRLQKLCQKEGILVEDLLDLGANKVFCLFDRFEPKDYIDLYFLHQGGYSLFKLRKAAEKKFKTKIDPIVFGTVLQKGIKIKFPPKALFKGKISAIQKFYAKAAGELKKEIFE